MLRSMGNNTWRRFEEKNLARAQRYCIVDAGRHAQNAHKRSSPPSASEYYIPGIQIKPELFVGFTHRAFFIGSPFSSAALFSRVIPSFFESCVLGYPGVPIPFESTSAPEKEPVRPCPVIPCKSHWPFKFLGGYHNTFWDGRGGLYLIGFCPPP